jgi:predicted  nucleic acid-binding Zn-ribbon protein
MKSSALSTLFLLSSFLSCNQRPAEDPRVPKLQQEVQSLNSKSDQLNQQVQQLQQQIAELQTRTLEQAQSRISADTNRVQEMTVTRMKREVEPQMTKLIDQSKAQTDTVSKGEQFGMRVEYDLKHAVYGLSRTQNDAAPYLAKVIVPYQKYVSSSKESLSYGSATREFIFLYSKGKWVLQKQ